MVLESEIALMRPPNQAVFLGWGGVSGAKELGCFLNWPLFLQMETTQQTTAKMSVVLPKVSEISVPSSPPKETLSQASMVSGTLTSIPALQPKAVSPEFLAEPMPVQVYAKQTRRFLSETLQSFCVVPQAHMDPLVPPAQLDTLLPLEKTDWSRLKILDLCTIDALNYFCEKQRAQQQSLLQDAKHSHVALCLPERNTVIPPPRDHRCVVQR